MGQRPPNKREIYNMSLCTPCTANCATTDLKYIFFSLVARLTATHALKGITLYYRIIAFNIFKGIHIFVTNIIIYIVQMIMLPQEQRESAVM